MNFTDELATPTIDSIRDSIRPAPWLLVAKSVMMQWAVGLLCVERLFSFGFSLLDENNLWCSFRFAAVLLAFILASVGMAIGEFERTSQVAKHSDWSIREKMVFVLWLLATGAYVVLLNDTPALEFPQGTTELCGWLATGLGLASLTSSGMVFVATQQHGFSARRVFVQFGSSTLLLSLTSGLVALNLARVGSAGLRNSSIATLLACVLLDAIAIVSSTRLINSRRAMRTNRYLSQPDNMVLAAAIPGTAYPSRALKIRAVLGWVSAIVVTLLVASQQSLSVLKMTDQCALVQTILIGFGILVRLASEVLERYLFLLTSPPIPLPAFNVR